ncbi:MAG TPA: HAD-IB family hydrolase [Spirochaetota bacterium]|nr:HAD-IB family hydrolase [Spirochaetota bacterium]HOS32839.1 HAD-IB family hydrolase [Spirochaetota bacterium]HOS55541.1 HAD-IB family hydrolase [Spirochaetota bacterium]HPK61131.1 HAD-IB family hydrolase [Spirochaetota bacterium]HQF77534.1 HAD-IB family hydrolase [Spirochaetota bacterium]
MKHKLALFDIDYTLISVDSLIKFIFYIFKLYPLKILCLPYLLLISLVKILGFISIETLKNNWLILLKNVPPERLDEISLNFVEKKIKRRIKPQVPQLIDKLRAEGYRIICASASFEFYVKHICALLNVTEYFGTKVEYKNKRYYVKGKNCKDYQKINRILSKISIDDIDVKNSVGYSDSKSDLPFLQIVKKFYLISKKRWKIKKEYKI